MKSKPNVLVTDESYNRGKQIYDAIEDLHIIPVPVDEERLAGLVEEHNAFAVVLGPETYSGPLYEAMKEKGVLARFGVGCDGVDLGKSRDNGLLVTNTPGVLEATVAEFTVFLAGEVLRSPGRTTGEMRQGIWNPVSGSEMQGITWAILGLGNIGKKVSRILSFGFGVKVYGLKKSISDEGKIRDTCGVDKVSTEYDKIAPFADIVSLHLPVNGHTRQYMNRWRLQQLKPGAVLINTGRGALVDENALYDAVRNDHLSGAGLDVFINEPYKPVAANKDLRDLSNVVLTPHIGSNTVECSARMTERVVRNIRLARKEQFDRMDIVSE